MKNLFKKLWLPILLSVIVLSALNPQYIEATGSALRKMLIFDINGRDLVLTTESNVPVALKDANGLDLELTAAGNVPVALRDANGRELVLEDNSSVPVTLQDQTTPPFIIQAHQSQTDTTLTSATAIDDLTINVVSSAGFTVGNYVGIFSTVTNRFYQGEVLSVLVNAVTLDTPIDSVFSIGDKVDTGVSNMNVDGSVTTQIYTLRGGDPGIDIDGDVTRIMITMITSAAPSYDKFGDIAGGLTRGIVMRTVSATGTVLNIFNIKSNGKLASISYDTSVFDPTNPSGVYGITSRLTFAGQDKFGVVLRTSTGDDIQFLIQDDLSSLVEFKITFEGSVALL